ncbi:outer membrane efflux protein [Flammeovirgaceae bacterium 311]|nr:outer membrane efflux protein [Flammeovirgaceae bacterium 311]
MKKTENSKYILLLLLIVLALQPAWSQEGQQVLRLRPEEAILKAMEQNLGVEISRQNQEISRRNYSLGNAGFLPSVSAAAARNWSLQNNEQTDRAGETRQLQGVRPNNLSYGVAASWRIFDGLGMFHSYERLRLEYEASGLLNQQTINELAANVLSTYYQHTLQQQRLELWENTLELSEQRLRLAKDRYEVGKTSKQEYLSALVDYNADRAAQLAQQEALKNTRHQLNRLMGQSPMQVIQTIDTLRADSTLIRELLLPQPVAQNPEYRASELQIAASESFVQEQRSRFWPSISADLGYNFARQNNPASFFLFNQTAGFNYGISASWFLFDGFNTRRNVQIARIQSQLADLDRRQLELDLQTSQADAMVAYRTQWQQIDLERENLEYAQQNADIAMERYRLGVTTPLELRVAQQNAQQAELRLLNAVYELKIAEIELMRISGQLVSGYNQR